MSRDDIIRMARKAGWSGIYCVKPFLSIKLTEDELMRFAALVAAAEREACAKVCEAYKFAPAAEAIRARGNT
jgi:hypothetical protein